MGYDHHEAYVEDGHGSCEDCDWIHEHIDALESQLMKALRMLGIDRSEWDRSLLG